MFRIFSCLALACSCLSFAHAARTEFTLGTLGKPPVIDGLVDEAGEWAGATSGEGALDVVTKGPSPENMRFWIAADEKYLYFAARMQEVATAFGRDDAARLVDACAGHWESVRPRVKERMAFEPGPCTVTGEAREEVIGRFVARLDKAVPQALAGLRVRGVLDPLMRRRNASLKGLAAIGLIFAIAAGTCGVLSMQQPAVLLLLVSLAVFGFAAVTAWITRGRIAAGYRDRLMAGAATFADGLKTDHGEAIRLLFRDYSSSLLEVRRRLDSEKAALQPRRVAADGPVAL